MRRFVFAAFALTVFAGCQAATTELTEERKAEIVAEIRQVYSGWLTTLDPINFDATLSYMHPAPEDYFVGEPAQWVNLLSVYPNTDRVREAWEPIMAQRRSQTQTVSEEYFAVLSENIALHILEGTYAITDTLGNTTDPDQNSLTSVWVRHEGEWKMLHMHQSWNPAN